MTGDDYEFSNKQLISCLEREIALRRQVYPSQVQQGRMTQTKADAEIKMMLTIRNMIESQDQPTLF